ncbi:MAG: VOC family protein [Deltaproteobacteria bacterium]|nr:VOC family protein [Deltaproteobacteria bacterium]
MSKVQAIPPQYGSLTPYLVVPRCDKAIEFYKQAFDAEEVMRMPMPDGSVGHAELKIGDSIVMVASSNEEWPQTSALTCLYVDDCDAVFHRALAAGAQEIEPLSDKFYGDRAGAIKDPFGQRWSIMTHKEDLSPEEMETRMAKMSAP